jgi:predicted metal-binding protein
MKGRPVHMERTALLPEGRLLDIAKSNPRVEDARLLPVKDIPIREWVREACLSCRYHGKSWSCPPGVGGLEQARRTLSGYSRAVFIKFKSSRDRAALERAVLDIESSLRGAGFPRALGFFASPCTACPECSYPGPCTRPGLSRPTGESWGIDLMDTSARAGLPVEIVREGEDFRPVTLLLLD